MSIKLTHAQLWTLLLASTQDNAVQYGGEDADNVSIMALRNLVNVGLMECTVYNGAQVYDLTVEAEEYLIDAGYVLGGKLTQSGRDRFIQLGGSYRHG